MKRLVLVLLMICFSGSAWAQCNGQFPAGAICGNPNTSSAAPPKATTSIPGTSSTFIQGGTGAVTRTMQAKARERVSVQDFGAVCDGATDDTTALTRAETYASANGFILTSGKQSCAYSGDWVLHDNFNIRDLTFVQLSPAAVGRRSIRYQGTACGSLINVKVNRNGTTSSGSISSPAAGVAIEGTNSGSPAADCYLENVEVYGDSLGVGIYLVDTVRLNNINPFVHDMRWAAGSDPGTEQVIGLWNIRGVDMYTANPRIRNLTGSIASGSFLPYQTDGLDHSNATHSNVVGGEIENVGEATDASGSALNTDIWFIGTSLKTIGSWGFKFTGPVSHSGVIGGRCSDCGLSMTVVDGTADGAPTDILWADMKAINTGSSGTWSASNIAGFSVLDDNATNHPSLINCTDCVAYDSGATMKYGFRDDTGSAFVLVRSQVTGATVSNYLNFSSSGSNIFQFRGTQQWVLGWGQTWGTNSQRQKIETVSSGNWASTTMQFDDNSAPNLIGMNNYGITGTNQGASYVWNFGASHSFGAIAGVLSVLSTDTWAAAGNRSAKMVAQLTQAGSTGTAWTATTTAFNIPTGSQYQINSTQIAASNLSNGTTGSGAIVLATSPSLTTPTLGVAIGTSLALGGCTIGTDALCTTGSQTFGGATSVVSSSFGLSGNISASAWTTNGVRYKNVAATLTDTSSSGTVAAAYTDVWGGNTIAASSATTYTNYYGSYFNNPVTGSNVTFTNRYAIGADGLAVVGGTLVDKMPMMTASGTMPTTITAAQQAMSFSVASAGTSSFASRVLQVTYTAGYTGSSSTQTISGTNSVAGTGSTLVPASGTTGATGNIGFQGNAVATTTGLNAGAVGAALGGNVNAGVIGSAQAAKNSATNIGVVGSAINTGTSPVHIGGFFSLNQTTVPTGSAALIADNGSQSNPVFIAAVNGTTKFSVDSGGTITNAGITTDATHTDATVCEDTTSHTFYFGSGAAGICLGTSGRQFKRDIVPMKAGLDQIAALNLVNYRYLPGIIDGGAREQYGLIAQDVERVLPDIVNHDADGNAINYDMGAVWFIGLKAIQELKHDNDNLADRVARLERRLAR